jgi:hypothetical protein
VEKLNNFELKVLELVSSKYPSLRNHIPYLRVARRKYTGVGIFVYFNYLEPPDDLKSLELLIDTLSTWDQIKIKGLKYDLSWEVVITDGRINFIEFVTNGNEAWDGSVNNFLIVETD